MGKTKLIRVLGRMKGDPGEPGKDYQLTPQDKEEIAKLVEVETPDGDGSTPPFDPSLAGKLIYIAPDGYLRPLTLGAGLEIVNGVLRLTGTVTPPDAGDDDEPTTATEVNTSRLGIAKLGLMILGRR